MPGGVIIAEMPGTQFGPSRRYGRRLVSPQKNSKIAEMEGLLFAFFAFLRGKKFIRVHRCPSWSNWLFQAGRAALLRRPIQGRVAAQPVRRSATHPGPFPFAPRV